MEETTEEALGVSFPPAIRAICIGAFAMPGDLWMGQEDFPVKTNKTYEVRTAPLWRHFVLKTIILPRQARDKHRKSGEKKAFVQEYKTTYGMFALLSSPILLGADMVRARSSHSHYCFRNLLPALHFMAGTFRVFAGVATARPPRASCLAAEP